MELNSPNFLFVLFVRGDFSGWYHGIPYYEKPAFGRIFGTFSKHRRVANRSEFVRLGRSVALE